MMRLNKSMDKYQHFACRADNALINWFMMTMIPLLTFEKVKNFFGTISGLYSGQNFISFSWVFFD